MAVEGRWVDRGEVGNRWSRTYEPLAEGSRETTVEEQFFNVDWPHREAVVETFDGAGRVIQRLEGRTLDTLTRSWDTAYDEVGRVSQVVSTHDVLATDALTTEVREVRYAHPTAAWVAEERVDVRHTEAEVLRHEFALIATGEMDCP